MKNNISNKLNKVGFKLKKHSPEIFVAVGIVGTVVSTVMACKATTKVSGILEKTKEDIDTIHVVANDKELNEQYTAEDVKKDIAIVYVQTGVKLVKNYAPSVALGVLSIGCILASNDILRKRNLALGAAYATVDRSFKEYRNRVVERFSEEVDKELRHGIQTKKIDTIVIDENGKEKKVKENIQVVDYPNEYSDYARFFDDGCTGWEKDSEYNLMFLRAQQQYANDKLRAKGYLFLSDVYEMLGIPESKASRVVGWMYDADNPRGDNYVDFGIYDAHRMVNRDFVNGYERTILLDFNVDGNIWDLM